MQRGSATEHPTRRAVTAALALLVAVAAIARFRGLGFGLPHTNTRPDETIIIDVVLAFLRGNFHPRFYDYPWFYMWVTSALYLGYYVWGLVSGAFQSVADLVASWRVHWVPFFMLPRALTAVCGTATVLVVFRIARRLWDDTTALVAALFIGLAFLHVRDSHYVTTDVMMTLLLVWSVSFLLDGHLKRRPRDFVVGGLVGGLAAATKYNALLLIVPLMASYLINVLEEPDRRRKALLDPRLLLYGIPFLMTFAVGVPFLVFDRARFFEDVTLLNQSMATGDLGLGLSAGWIHHLEYSLRYGLGLPLLVAGIAGTFAILALEPHVGILLLSFPISYFIVAGSFRNLFFRYVIPMVPFLCIAAARLVTWVAPPIYTRLAARLNRQSAVSGFRLRARLRPTTMASATAGGRTAAVAVVAIALVLPSAASVWQFDRIISQTDNRVVVARWFDEHVPAGSSVLLSGSFYGYVQTTRDMGYRAWVWDRNRLVFVTDLDKRPGVGRPEWILVQDSPLPNETQPIVLEFLKEDYAFVKFFPAFSRHDDHVYDQQDAFFAPYAGFSGVERPGPNYSLYKRISAP